MAWRRQKRGKYGNIRTSIDGHCFDSKAEAARYVELKLLENAGEISNLCVDKPLLRYDLIVNGVWIGTYEADYRYMENGQLIVEDRKGMRTPAYVIKRRLMHACFGIHIRET